jgi:CHAT domain-containing protein
MMQLLMSRCPDEETLAAWVEGRLSIDETAELMEHASVCEECISMIDAANETFHAEAATTATAGMGWQRWFLAAAAVLVVAFATIIGLRLRSHDAIQDLVSVAPRSARAVEARLSGGFPWAPYRGAMRANGVAADTGQMKLIGAASEAMERAQHDTTPDAQHAAAVALVLIERPEEATTRLTVEAKRSPNDAGAWSDLAAAQYAAALAGRTALYPEALASADRALGIDPRSLEALFNRALILERLGLRSQARAAWQHYLENDSSSQWAGEAREHLAKPAAAREAPSFDSDRPQLEAAAAAEDDVLTRTLVGRQRERARAYAEAEYLGRWADAMKQSNAGEAAKWLTISRGIGGALVSVSGESLLHDAVQAIDTAEPARRLRIAEAHLTYRKGRIAYSRRELSAGESDLRLAADQFASAGDPMSLAARSYAAGARLAQNDAVSARRELAALLTEVDAARGYFSLAGQVRWELARGLMFDDDWTGAARNLGEAELLFGRAGESVNQATVGNMLADALIALGRPDEGWSAHVRTFETFTAAGRIDLLAAAVGGAATTALRSGKTETARALVNISESLDRELSNDQLLADTLVRKSLLATPIDADAALRSAGEAVSVAMRIPNEAIRARHLADADVAMAAALLGSHPRRAHDFASRSLDLYVANRMIALVAEPYLIRARASLRLGDSAAAERDLDAGMNAVEQHSNIVAGAVIGTGVLDAANALFEESIRLDLDRRDVTSAFAHSERLHGVAAGSGAVEELRARLAGSGTAVVALVVLPREVVSLTVTEHGATAARSAIAREDLAGLAARDDDAAASALYDLLIRPSAPSLADSRSLIIVPDVLLERVSFAALRDGNHTLIERMTVAIAPNAMSLVAHTDAARPEIVTTIGLPSGAAADSVTLPEVEIELAEIGRLYRTLRRVSPANTSARGVEENAAGADVLHIAGHTEGEAATGDQALALAGGAVSWRTIAAMHDMAPVVVLSACNTLRRSHDQDRRALSLAGAFVAAGAREVVGTLAPIGDADARALFFALHEQLARGVAVPAALRQVQLAQLQRPGGAWRRLELLTTVIHRTD